MSARSRATPWWGPRKVFGPSPAQTVAKLEWLPAASAFESAFRVTDTYALWKDQPPGDPVADMKNAIAAIERLDS